MVVKAKRDNPILGPKKIIPNLRDDHPDLPWPAPSTDALGQRPPASRYAPSPRPYPDKVASPEYAAGVEVRRVRSNGEIKWAGERVFVSEALIGEPVGLVRHDDRLWTVRFGHLEIGRLDGYALRIIKTPVKALPMYPG